MKKGFLLVLDEFYETMFASTVNFNQTEFFLDEKNLYAFCLELVAGNEDDVKEFNESWCNRRNSEIDNLYFSVPDMFTVYIIDIKG